MRKTKRVDHRKTQTIIVKKAVVDSGIVKLVKWFNSFEGVTTQYCCQGSDADRDEPYVLFTCISDARLLYIISILQDWGWFEIHLFCNTIRYTYRVNSPRELKDLQDCGFIKNRSSK